MSDVGIPVSSDHLKPHTRRCT